MLWQLKKVSLSLQTNPHSIEKKILTTALKQFNSTQKLYEDEQQMILGFIILNLEFDKGF